MVIHFYKYHGTGNDFILLDCRKEKIALSKEQIAFLCHRRFGIGADGLMYLEEEKGYDFRMVYFNADGGESTMCGNGGRCIVAFAHKLGIVKDTARFVAIDGEHTATLQDNGTIHLHMNDVAGEQVYEDHVVLNTGSPHYVKWVNNTADTDVYGIGKQIRYSEAFAPGGINVNFVQKIGDKIKVRTYERGVEDETLSCGTGVVASAIAATGNETGSFTQLIETPGGELQVLFTKDTATSAKDVVLCGPTTYVYEGDVMV